MITLSNYSEVESELNEKLRKQPGFECWMYFSVQIMNGTTDRFTVGYVLPASYGIETDMTLEKALSIYGAVTQQVLSG